MAGLLDFIQGASNSAASTLSGPVDLINMGLLGLGLPMPANPVGGSQWMREKGLTREPQNRTAGLLGEAAGNILPIVAAAKGPQIAQGLLNHAEAYRKYHGATTAPGAPATVWHGSPHRFDKFDSSKIGTGEGAQAYGHGLYFAESPDVAKSYKPKTGAPSWKGKPVASYGMDGSVQFADGTVAKVADGEWSAFRQAMESGPRSGHLYKVDLPDEAIARMLDWDKPLSQQPEAVRKALAKVDKDMYHPSGADYDATELGQMIYNRLSSKAQAAGAANTLRNLGVPGLRYLDGGSRTAGTGSSNFVVFPGNEGLLTILGRE
jgi:hypothetical protein